jgi:hypothetical membrane protein
MVLRGLQRNGLEMNKRTAGALCWLSSAQFFIAQAWVALAWTPPFSLFQNFISDLGNTGCGLFKSETQMYVCSPRHALMNASFVVLGLSIVVGGVLTHELRRPGITRQFARAFMVVAGIGGIVVGWFPENENLLLHSLGALAYFLFANVGLVLLGRSAAGTAVRAKGLTLTLGFIGIAATVLFFSESYFGLGIGGTERLLVYPLPLALTLNGGLLLLDRGAPDVDATVGAG